MQERHSHLTENYVAAFDRYQAHMRQREPNSLEDLAQVTPLQVEMLVAHWAACLDVKTRHDLMKSSLDAIR